MPPSREKSDSEATVIPTWKKVFGVRRLAPRFSREKEPSGDNGSRPRPERWSLGVLNDRETDEVPGMSVSILSSVISILCSMASRRQRILAVAPAGAIDAMNIPLTMSRLHPLDFQIQSQRAAGSS